MTTRLILALLAAACILPPLAARAETTQCTRIQSLPATLTTQGIYCLRGDLATSITSGAAISIVTNNVTLDCNGWKVGGLAAGNSTNTTGVYASGRQNLTIRNCGLRGFRDGIYISGGAGHAIEGNRIDNSTETGISVSSADSVLIRDNRIIDTGGGSSEAYGMRLSHGANYRVVGNTIHNVVAVGTSWRRAWGILFSNGGHEFSGNHISNLVPAGGATAEGIMGANAGQEIQAAIKGNTIQNPVLRPGYGLFGGSGSQCRDNFVRNFQSGMTSCGDAGGNLVSSAAP